MFPHRYLKDEVADDISTQVKLARVLWKLRKQLVDDQKSFKRSEFLSFINNDKEIAPFLKVKFTKDDIDFILRVMYNSDSFRVFANNLNIYI
jgi:hypothetical protein